MNSTSFRCMNLLSIVVSLAVITGGCGRQASDSSGDATTVAEQLQDGQAAREDASHGGWWCVEHGIPEEQCSMCSSKAADAFKAKGDWCEDHNRAESQCFICDPTKAEKFAKLYEAKVGRKPPELEEADE